MAITPLNSGQFSGGLFTQTTSSISSHEDGDVHHSTFTANFAWQKKAKDSASRQQQILSAAMKAASGEDENNYAKRSLEGRKAARAMLAEGEQSTIEVSEEVLEDIQEEMEAQAQETQKKKQEEKPSEKISEEKLSEIDEMNTTGDNTPQTTKSAVDHSESLPTMGKEMDAPSYDSSGELSENANLGNAVDTRI